jgi:catechol 2,3-dioxygenase-like lactoylglutathione lyase family enzyme
MAIDILRIVHGNVNCSDLERSLAFYRDFVGLEPVQRTHPEPQDGSGFGMRGDVQWDAWMMSDGRWPNGTVIDLLEWKQPAPVGVPAAAANHLGMFRVCLSVPDLDALYERARADGVPCLSPPADVPIQSEHAASVRALFTRDPDGTLVEFIEQPGNERARLVHVNVNCSELAHSRAWYERVLGLEVRGGSAPGPIAGEAFGFAGSCEYEASFLFAKDGGFAVDLLEWKRPAPVGAPYASANHLGLYRLAFLVADARASWEELARLGVECPEPVLLDMGPGIPVDGVWAVFFPDPDGTCLELIESPRVIAS